MEDNYLKEYKTKIGKLNVNDQKLRDLYLRDLALGKLQGPPIGYVGIDKPWLKFFSEEYILEDLPKMSMYEYMNNNNKGHEEEVAIEYLGTKIKYKELFKKIEEVASAFKKNGIKEGDIVTICSITTPEIIYSIYALNKIGAICNIIDVRYTKQAIEKYIKEVDSKFFITLDICYPKVNEIINSVDKTIFLSATNSAPIAIKMLSGVISKIKKEKPTIPYNDKVIDWNDFVKYSKNENVNTIAYNKDRPALIIHTGGTTGNPKGAILTNDNVIAATIQIKNSNCEVNRGDRFLNIMPPFIAYGVVLGINVPLSLGWQSIVIPKFDAEKFDELLLKNKPNALIGVPAYWETVMNSEKVQKSDMSYIKVILLGGDKTKPEFEKKLDAFLKEKGCNANVGKGYSMTEASACATFSSRKSNKLGSVGVPLTKTTIAAFEPGTDKELKTGEIGELYIKTPTTMTQYFNDEERTKDIKQKHNDGIWLHSGDIGYVDEDGIVFIKDRIKRMIIRSGFKVFPSEMENLFMKHPQVENCAVVGIPDVKDVTAPKVYLVTKENIDQDKIINDLKDMLYNSELPPYFEPVDYEFLNELPLTNIGKIDFVKLQENHNTKKLIKK